MIAGAIVGFSLARGAWHGLRGRTKLIRSRGLGTFAYGDGERDDGAYIQREIDKHADCIVRIPAGTFNVSRPIVIQNMGLIGNGQSTALRFEGRRRSV